MLFGQVRAFLLAQVGPIFIQRTQGSMVTAVEIGSELPAVHHLLERFDLLALHPVDFQQGRDPVDFTSLGDFIDG